MRKKFSDFLLNFENKKDFEHSKNDSKLLVYSTRRHSRFENYSMLIGGLADRLKGIVLSYLFSVYYKRSFAIEWFTPCPLEPSLRHNICDWQISNWNNITRKPLSVKHIDLIDQVSLLESTSPEILKNTFSEDEQIIYINNNIFSHTLCKKMFPDYEPSDVFNAAFSTLFKFYVPDNFKDLWKQTDDEIIKPNGLIGVHWRTGGGNGWEDPVMGNWSDAIRAVEYSIEKTRQFKDTTPSVYFASDSEEAKKAVSNHNFNTNVIVSKKEVLHIDKEDPGSRDGFDFALTEFMILSKCDTIFGGAGQYWVTAALIGGKKMCYIEL